MFPHFADVAPVTAAQAAAVLTEMHTDPRIVHFDRVSSALAVVATAYILAIIWLITATGLAIRMRNWARRIAPGLLFVQGAIVYFLTMCVLALAGLPLSSYRGYILLRRYGLVNETYLAWLSDHLKAIAIDAFAGMMIAGMALVLIKRQPKRWPLWLAAALTPLIAFGIFLEPIVVDPSFNHFYHLSQSRPIYFEIKQVAQKAGIGNADIFVVDKSKQTNETNAYVTGIGPSARIVLWDTLLNRMTNREIVAIAGHEMGHYVEGHLIIGFGLTVIGLFALFPALAKAADYLRTRWKPATQILSLHDPAAIPLLLLTLQLLMLLVQPVSNQVSRWIEHKADGFSLGIVRDRVGLADALIDLGKQNLEDPDQSLWEKFWFDDHPPLRERVEYALYGQPDR